MEESYCFTLILNIHGLCFYLPEKKGEKPNSMHVLLADPGLIDKAARPTPLHEFATQPHAAHQHETHHPVLVFNELDVAYGCGIRKPDFKYHDGNPRVGYLLRNFEFDLGSCHKPLIVDEAETGTCPTEKNQRSFGWVIPLDRIDSALGHMDPRTMAKKDRCHDLIAARVNLHEGYLSTAYFASSPQSTTIWEFIPAGGDTPSHKQAVADVVQFELRHIQHQLEIKLENLRYESKAKPIIVRPYLGTELTAWLKCMSMDDIMGLRKGQPLIPGATRSRDYHFAHFFDLFGPGHSNEHPYVPRLSRHSCDPIGHPPPTLTSIHCPGATINESHLEL